MKASIISNIAWGLMAFLLAGCGGKPDPRAEVEPTPEEIRTKPSTIPDDPQVDLSEPLGKPDFVLAATAWSAEFDKDSDSASQKYRGKVIELSGVVERVADDPNGAGVFVSLQTPGDPIRCFTKERKPWKRVSPGSKVKLLGRADDSGRDLHSAEIAEAGPNPGIVISARQLSKEFAADRKSAKKKFDEKYASIEGEIVGKASGATDTMTLMLQGERNISVQCTFAGSANSRALHKAKEGQRVSVFGRLSLFDGDKDNVIYLPECYLTELK
jgi:hypothetical protein